VFLRRPAMRAPVVGGRSPSGPGGFTAEQIRDAEAVVPTPDRGQSCRQFRSRPFWEDWPRPARIRALTGGLRGVVTRWRPAECRPARSGPCTNWSHCASTNGLGGPWRAHCDRRRRGQVPHGDPIHIRSSINLPTSETTACCSQTNAQRVRSHLDAPAEETDTRDMPVPRGAGVGGGAGERTSPVPCPGLEGARRHARHQRAALVITSFGRESPRERAGNFRAGAERT
jgi:hypothetical protein